MRSHFRVADEVHAFGTNLSTALPKRCITLHDMSLLLFFLFLEMELRNEMVSQMYTANLTDIRPGKSCNSF